MKVLSVMDESSEKNVEINKLMAEHTARIAHDISSPIAVMELTLQLLSKEIKDDDLKIMKKALESIRVISNDLISQPYVQQKIKNTDVNDVGANSCMQINNVLPDALIAEIVEQKRREWINQENDLVYTVSRAAKLFSLKVNPGKLKRVISNLLNNANEACKGKAKILVRLHMVGRNICISIADNGCGIPRQKFPQILTGKSTRHAGKGLGLSGACDYMNTIGGELSISSKVGKGTRVRLLFPQAQPQPHSND